MISVELCRFRPSPAAHVAVCCDAAPHQMRSRSDRVCEPGDDVQCPNDKKPIFFTSASTRAARAAFLAGEAPAVCYFRLAALPRSTNLPGALSPGWHNPDRLHRAHRALLQTAPASVPVNVDNFARAESGRMFAAILSGLARKFVGGWIQAVGSLR